MSNGNSEDDGPGTAALLAAELVKVVQPAVTAFEGGPDDVETLLEDMGVEDQLIEQNSQKVFDTVESDIKNEGGNLQKTVVSLAEETGSSEVDGLEDIAKVDWVALLVAVEEEDIESIVKSAKGIISSIEALSEVEFKQPQADTFAEAVIDYLLIEYLRRHHHAVYGWCCTAGIIVEHGPDKPSEIRLSAIPEIVQNPEKSAKELFQWSEQGQSFLAYAALYYVKEAFVGHGVPVNLRPAPEDDLRALTGADQAADLAEDVDTSGLEGFGRQLSIPLFGFGLGPDTPVEAGIRVIPVPPNSGQGDLLPGVALVLYGTLNSGMSASLGSGWSLAVDGSGELANRGVVINPKADGSVETTPVNLDAGTMGGGDTLAFTLTISSEMGGEARRKTVVSTAAGGLDFKNADVEIRFRYEGGEFVFAVEFHIEGTVHVEPQGGFLEEVIPEPIEYDFEVTVGWSSKSGLYFDSGGTLEVSLADNIPLGPLVIEETYLDITPGGGDGDDGGDGGDGGASGIPATIGTTPALDLGFLKAQVRRMGLKADVSFPEDRDGNLGPADVDIGFEPPNGLALGVDVGPVSGGGVIKFFPDENRYSGALQLRISDYVITAVGLLKTELPGGGDGYSFLLLITAELPPIQLGFGFTLNGIGGLAGIHRSMKRKPLAKAVRTGSLDSILFPQNVVENANRIISDLRSIFPPTRDQHVFGPVAKFGWGTPTILTMEVGVVLQVPSIEIAILGAFHLDMPDEEAGLISLNLAVVGYLDIPDKFLSIDARLYDSRIVSWTVSGDMAMRLRWGDNSKFLLSVGGFNPRWDPPKKFPDLDRITASLTPPGGQPRLEYTGYLAVTPNTFQVGAAVALHGEFGPLTVDGKLALDALFQFNPFKFVVDFLAKLSVTFKGKGLSVKIDGQISGPGPFRVKGKVHVEVLMFEVTARMDISIGSGGKKEELPKANVMPQLTEALGRPGNWAAQVPEGEGSLVTLRQGQREQEEGQGSQQSGDSEGGSSKVIAHPMGGITVRQTVVPLRERIGKFGNAVPSDYESFRIASVTVNEEKADSMAQLREKFAPAKYRKMSDSEKMNAPAFVERTAGTGAGDDRLHYGGETDDSHRATARLEYETTVIDREENNYRASLSSLGAFARLRTRPEAARIGIEAGRLDQLLRQTAAADLAVGNEFVGTDPSVVGVGGMAGKGLVEDDIETVDGDQSGGRTGDTLLESGEGVSTFDSEVTLSSGSSGD